MKISWQNVTVTARLVPVLLVVLFVSGCRTASPFAPVDLSEPGWTQREYQVVWKAGLQADELVCDVIEARHVSGRMFLQASKTPLVLATVQVEGAAWWVKYGPRPRSARGNAPPDAAHLWVLLALQQREARHLKIETMSGGNERWMNLQSGERIEGVPGP